LLNAIFSGSIVPVELNHHDFVKIMVI